MKRLIYILLGLAAVVLCCVATCQYIQNHNIAVLEPKGSIAYQERELIYICSLLMLLVAIPVIILLFVFAYKYRIGNDKAKYAPEWAHSYLGEIIWWGVPFLLIGILGWITWDSTHALNPYAPLQSNKKPIKIQVIALNWKWLFIYPELGIATVNYIQFPVSSPLNFQITSDAPMNSFWIPQLGGQIYAMPGMRSKLHLVANETGTFRGLTTSINGKGFAGMQFQAKATTEEEFDAWVSEVKMSPNVLTMQSYDDLLKPSENNPVSYYSNVEGDVFEEVVMKAMYHDPKNESSMSKINKNYQNFISLFPGKYLLPKFQSCGVVCSED